MSKLNRLGTMLLLAGFVGVAWGAATKISSFVMEKTFTSCFDGIAGDEVPLNMDPAADGMAILNYVAGSDKTIVQVIVSDFSGAPLQRFIVRLDPVPCDLPPCDLGTFLVDSQGNGHFHGEISGDHSGSNVKLFQQPDPPPCPAVLIASGKLVG